MARIRTIKPEFFTSEDIVGLSLLGRLLYIALWCEADKEGRMVWKPKTFKMRYLPADACDIDALCKELIDAGLVALYGNGYAHIPAFKAHQHVNPRETASQLPDPTESTRDARVGTRQPRVIDAQRPDSDAQVGREGKGREGDAPLPPKGVGQVEVPDWMPAKPWEDFVAMRRAKGQKAPFTVAAAKGIITKLSGLKAAGHDVAESLSQSVINGWSDVFEPRGAAGGRSRGTGADWTGSAT
jgi:hypothetical protein